MLISYYEKGKKEMDLLKRYSKHFFSSYDGSKAYPYNRALPVDLNNEKDRKRLMNLTKSFTHAPFVFLGGARSISSFLEASALFLDFDKGDMTYDEWKSTPIALKVQWVSYASKTLGCFHVLIPLEKPIKSSHFYTFALNKIIEDNGIISDKATRDCARQILPSRSPGEPVPNHYFFRYHKGPKLSLDFKAPRRKRVKAQDRGGEARTLSVPEKVSVKNLNNPEGQARAVLMSRTLHIEFPLLLEKVVADVTSSLSVPEYQDWVKVGFSIKRILGERGAPYWVEFCKRGEKYRDSDDDVYDTLTTEIDEQVFPLLYVAGEYGYTMSDKLLELIIGWDRAIVKQQAKELRECLRRD